MTSQSTDDQDFDEYDGGLHPNIYNDQTQYIYIGVTCPRGDLCPIRQSHIHNRNLYDNHPHLSHLQQVRHFCPYFEDVCPLVQKREIHSKFLHPCKDGVNCPYLFFVPTTFNDISQYNKHISEYYHFCHLMGKCPLLQNVVHRAQFRHTPDININLHIPDEPLPVPIKEEVENKDMVEVYIHKKCCDTCGKLSAKYNTLFCSHIMCYNCENTGKKCTLCITIRDLLSDSPQHIQEHKFSFEREQEQVAQCATCNISTPFFVPQNGCGHIVCLKCLGTYESCQPCREERIDREIKEEHKRHLDEDLRIQNMLAETHSQLQQGMYYIDDVMKQKTDCGENPIKITEIDPEKKIGSDIDNTKKGDLNADYNLNECRICFQNIRDEDKRILLCAHFFHEHCIQNWFEIKGQDICPICRQDMEDLERKQQKFLGE